MPENLRTILLRRKYGPVGKLQARLRGCRRSLTIWFNGVAGGLVLLLPVAQDSFPQMQAYIPDNAYRLAMGIIVAANILLRFKTTVDLADKPR